MAFNIEIAAALINGDRIDDGQDVRETVEGLKWLANELKIKQECDGRVKPIDEGKEIE